MRRVTIIYAKYRGMDKFRHSSVQLYNLAERIPPHVHGKPASVCAKFHVTFLIYGVAQKPKVPETPTSVSRKYFTTTSLRSCVAILMVTSLQIYCPGWR